jgi:hypothetical protein
MKSDGWVLKLVVGDKAILFMHTLIIIIMIRMGAFKSNKINGKSKVRRQVSQMVIELHSRIPYSWG